MNVFLPQDFCPHDGVYHSRTKCVKDALLLVCAGVTPVWLWFVILFDKIGDFFSPPGDFYLQGFHKWYLLNLIMHGVAPECESISYHERLYLCNSKKTAGGWLESTLESCLGARKPFQSQTRFFAHASSTLTDHGKLFTQCDISCSLSLSLASSRVSEL